MTNYVAIRHALEQLFGMNANLRAEKRRLIARVEELSDAHNLATDEITRLRALLASAEPMLDNATYDLRAEIRVALSGREAEREAERAAWEDLMADPHHHRTGAEPRPYLIQHISDVDEETREPLFWNNDDGYGHRATATHFTTAQRATMHLPTGGFWLLVEGFHGDGCGPSEVKP